MDSDCLLCIFRYLTIADIKTIFTVCKQFNKILNSELLWKQLFADKFNKIIVHNNYKLKYRQFANLDKFLIEFAKKKINNVYNSETIDLIKKHPRSLPKELGLLPNLRRLEVYSACLPSNPKIKSSPRINVINFYW